MTDQPTPDTPYTDATAALFERLASGDGNPALALGALIEVADDTGAAPLHAVTSRYREALLRVREHEGRDLEDEARRLSLEEVRNHLCHSVFPRLADEAAVVLPHGALSDPEDILTVSPALWAEVSPRRQHLARRLRETGEHPLQPRAATPAAGGVLVDNPSVLSAEGLIKVYRGRRVVNDVALRVSQGEIVGLLGPNGAGKTTTFYMLVGLIAPQAGSIQLEGKDITSMPMYQRARHGIGYLSQEPSVFRKLTVEQNILAILETLPLSAADRKERLETLLDELDIKHLRNSRAYQLSGGERRRLEITRALVTQPKFMMLDEPFAGVDPIAVHDIQTIVANLRYRGIGVLISDHNVEQTLDIVDRAYIMFEGQVKVSGTVRELVFDETVAEIYLGPTLTARLRSRFSEAEEGVLAR
jgi:lipopolysaccharide export system ATP-binding protein